MEVAEGGIGLVGGCLAGTPRLECEGHAKTESIAQRSRSRRGGIGLVGGCLAGTPRPECEGHAKMKSIAQRSRRSQRGNWIGRRMSGREHRGLSAKIARRQETPRERRGCLTYIGSSTLLLLEYLAFQLQRHPLERCLTNSEAKQR
jgi:hypothetical protein